MIIKEKPEDFIVEEKPYEYFTKDNGYGIYYYYWLTKKNIEQYKAIKKISKLFKKSIKEISFSGIKDKKAITKQIFSVKGKLKGLKDNYYKDDEIKIEFAGRGKRPVAIGFTKGNKFTITVRDLPLNFELTRKPERIPNYYDSQRFGKDLTGVKIGKAIVKGDFSRLMKTHKIKSFNDIRAKFNKYQVRFYISAYGSYLFNKILARLIEKIENKNIIRRHMFMFIKDKEKSKIDENFKVPLPGFGLNEEIEDLELYKEELREIIDNLFDEEGINERSFIIKSMPEISNESISREGFIKVENFRIVKEDKDELHHNKKKIVLSFDLPPGSYATMVIKDLFVELI